jgi:signal peptidase I
MRVVRTLLQPLLIAIVLALAVRSALFRVYAIPSQSMAPALQPGDQIVVTPYRVPFASAPERGDVVVFRSPAGRDELMVKRIIATPGDLIETRDGRVIVSGHPIAEPYVMRQGTTGVIAPLIVASNCYFVAGDNRENSWDSRAWGILPRDLVVGRARFVLWSWGDGSTEPQANAATITQGIAARHRLGRIFQLIR